jgi:hypothetical protein
MKKILKRYTSLKNYIAFLKRQPQQMQHVYAFIFAGSITIAIAAVILYVDYGFWHEQYSSKTESDVEIATTTEMPESPIKMLSRFLGEAKTQLNNINASGSDLLQGKETYTNESN